LLAGQWPWLGKGIYLRSRILNQDNKPGIESPQVYLQIDGFYSKSAKY
jgi:hypothetical protein